MIRKTSLATFLEIRDSGLLSAKRLQVYDIVYHHGPLTGAETSLIMGQLGQRNNISSENVRNRLSELVKFGALEEIKVDRCPITGRNVLFYDVTGKLPSKPAPKATKDQIIKELEGQIRKMKNCGNCQKSVRYFDRKDCPNDYTIFYCDKWELAK